MTTRPLVAVPMDSLLQRAPSKKAVWSTRPVKTQGKRPTLNNGHMYKANNHHLPLISRFGCCRDGFTMATGLNFAGCPTGVCEETLFGCCDDGETPASALPKAKRRRRRQTEESGDGKRTGYYCPIILTIFSR